MPRRQPSSTMRLREQISLICTPWRTGTDRTSAARNGGYSAFNVTISDVGKRGLLWWRGAFTWLTEYGAVRSAELGLGRLRSRCVRGILVSCVSACLAQPRAGTGRGSGRTWTTTITAQGARLLKEQAGRIEAERERERREEQARADRVLKRQQLRARALQVLESVTQAGGRDQQAGDRADTGLPGRGRAAASGAAARARAAAHGS